MEIKFLGTGGAFDYKKGTSAAIIEYEGTKVLIDCGFATFQTLLEKKLAADIDYVLLTHLHGDHVGSLPTFLAYAEIIIGKELPIIIPSDSFQTEVYNFLDITFEAKRAHFVSITDFPWIGFIDTFGKHVPDRQSYAYYFQSNDELIYYSGDLKDIAISKNFLATRTEKNIRIFHDTAYKFNPGHTTYAEVQEQLSPYDVYGYHCDKAKMPDDCTVKLVEDYPELNY